MGDSYRRLKNDLSIFLTEARSYFTTCEYCGHKSTRVRLEKTNKKNKWLHEIVCNDCNQILYKSKGKV